MRRFREPILFGVLLIVQISGFGFAESADALRVVVDGFAYGSGVDARDAAVTDARQKAVTIWLDANLGSYTPEDGAFFLGQVDALLLSHRVLYQRSENQGVRIGIEAYLDVPKLRLQAAQYFMPRLKRKPHVVFLVGERHPRGAYTTGYHSAAITALKSVFEKSGFQVIPESALVSMFTEIELADRISGGYDSVAKVGRSVQADIVVTGEVRVAEHPSQRSGNLVMYHSEAKLSVVRAEDGQPMEATSSQSETTSARPADGIRIAVEDAVYKAQQPLLVAAVLGSLHRADTQAIFLTLEGEVVQQHLSEIVALLRSIPSVNQLETLRTRPHMLYFRLDYSGKISTLVDTLDEASLVGMDLDPWKIIGSDLQFKAVVR